MLQSFTLSPGSGRVFGDDGSDPQPTAVLSLGTQEVQQGDQHVQVGSMSSPWLTPALSHQWQVAAETSPACVTPRCPGVTGSRDGVSAAPEEEEGQVSASTWRSQLPVSKSGATEGLGHEMGTDRSSTMALALVWHILGNTSSCGGAAAHTNITGQTPPVMGQRASATTEALLALPTMPETSM